MYIYLLAVLIINQHNTIYLNKMLRENQHFSYTFKGKYLNMTRGSDRRIIEFKNNIKSIFFTKRYIFINLADENKYEIYQKDLYNRRLNLINTFNGTTVGFKNLQIAELEDKYIVLPTNSTSKLIDHPYILKEQKNKNEDENKIDIFNNYIILNKSKIYKYDFKKNKINEEDKYKLRNIVISRDNKTLCNFFHNMITIFDDKLNIVNQFVVKYEILKIYEMFDNNIIIKAKYKAFLNFYSHEKNYLVDFSNKILKYKLIETNENNFYSNSNSSSISVYDSFKFSFYDFLQKCNCKENFSDYDFKKITKTFLFSRQQIIYYFGNKKFLLNFKNNELNELVNYTKGKVLTYFNFNTYYLKYIIYEIYNNISKQNELYFLEPSNNYIIKLLDIDNNKKYEVIKDFDKILIRYDDKIAKEIKIFNFKSESNNGLLQNNKILFTPLSSYKDSMLNIKNNYLKNNITKNNNIINRSEQILKKLTSIYSKFDEKNKNFTKLKDENYNKIIKLLVKKIIDKQAAVNY